MICQKCGNDFPFNEGMKFCPHCGESIQQPEAAPEFAPVEAGPDQPPTDGKIKAPWEDRAFSYLEGFWITFRESVFNAGDFLNGSTPKAIFLCPCCMGSSG